MTKIKKKIIIVSLAVILVFGGILLWALFQKGKIPQKEITPVIPEKEKTLEKIAELCDISVTFTYKGSSVTYGTVLSINDKCWLDRNLGASQVATAYNDANAYGDLFQWGRLDDGHQTRTSNTTTTLSSSDDPEHSNFIKAPNSPYGWRSPQGTGCSGNSCLWQGVLGTNNPCPSGWRIPTEAEWQAEINSWDTTVDRRNDAYASPLKLPAGGYRFYSNASLYNVGSYGFYWSSTVSSTNASYLSFHSSDAYVYSNYRAYGFSVRCVQD